SVAGYSKYIINCYAKNVTVEASVTAPMKEQSGYSPISGSYVDRTYYSLSVGGIAGGCYVMDCCWSDADVIVRADDTDVPSWHIGGLAGLTVTGITSYFDGTVDAGTLPDDGMFYVIKNDVPQILTETVYREIRDRLAQIDEKKSTKFAAFYVRKPFGLTGAWRPVVQDLLARDAEELDAVYVCDPDMKPREYAELSGLIGEAFPDGGFEAYCRENGIKYGCYYVYDLRTEPDAHFEGFDSAIWNVTPGERPTLKIFG
nr:hypothetical protein [Clostridiales bacterium]